MRIQSTFSPFRESRVSALPENLPAISNARLPQSYEAAKNALAECSRIDECQEWANKAEALASYAKQAKDDQLRKYADRIQARAIRRCGELLKTYSEGREKGGRPSVNGTAAATVSQRSAAEDAGLSKRQQVTAVNVANVPAEKFEKAVEAPNPPSVTKLAEIGKKTQPKPTVPLVDLKGIDPKEFAMSTDGQGQLRQLAEFAKRVDAAVVARGAMPNERKSIRQNIATIDGWLDRLIVQLED